MKIAAVVVTFNRKEMLIDNLKCLLQQSRCPEKVYIIDNASTDGTYEYIERVIEENDIIQYIRLDENLGGAGGFSYGLKVAFNDGYDYIWGMDDDAFPDKLALENLVTFEKLNNELCCLWSNCNNDSIGYNDEGYKVVNNWMFVGFFIPTEIIKNVGLPRAEFFIYHDDTEYAERIIKKGYKIYKIKNSNIIHGDFTSREFMEKKIGRINIIFPKMPDWKLYYYERNFLLKYTYKDISKYTHIFYHIPKDILKMSVLDKSKCKIIIKAYIDGIRGIGGKKQF